MHTSRKTKILTALGGLAVAGLVASVARADVPESDGTLHLCYQTNIPTNGTNLKLIDPDHNGVCGSGTSEVTINSASAPFSFGSTDEITVSDFVTLDPGNPPSNGPINAFGSCPSDHPYLVSGGYSMLSNESALNGGGTPNDSVQAAWPNKNQLPQGLQMVIYEATPNTTDVVKFLLICAS